MGKTFVRGTEVGRGCSGCGAQSKPIASYGVMEKLEGQRLRIAYGIRPVPGHRRHRRSAHSLSAPS